MYYLRFILFLIVLGTNIVFGNSYYIDLLSNGPAVLGATIKFTAELFLTNGEIPSGTFKYEWRDNALEPHKKEIESTSHISTWEVTYPASNYVPGPYEVQVAVSKWTAIYWWPCTSQRIIFNVTAMLNGNLNLLQANKTISTYVSSSGVVQNEVMLTQPDLDFLTRNATSIFTYWFVDCVNYGFSGDFKFLMNFTKPEKTYYIEALVVAGYEPITTTTIAPTTTTSTTTIKPNITTLPPTTTTIKTTTTVKSTTTSPTTVTTVKPLAVTAASNISPNITLPIKEDNSSKVLKSSIQKRSINKRETINNTVLNSVKDYNKIEDFPSSEQIKNITMPFVCFNKSIVPPDPKKTYGYFSRKFIVKAPVKNITVLGNNWLQHGDLLNLHVSWSGSAPYQICFSQLKGLHNITGNETCYFPIRTVIPAYNFSRYLRDATEYTIIIFIQNDVQKTISPVTVTVYKAIHHPQLSVIVVPVSFSLVAVVLIVFGVAYYIQSRMRYTVEVADFDFGQQYSDLEYKTFSVRLRESIVNAFSRAPITGQESPDWSPTTSGGGFKYGSMT